MELDINVVNELISEIYKQIENKIDKKLNNTNIEFTWSGIVNTVNGDNAVVDLGFQKTQLIPNLTGQPLAVKDTVKVYSDKMNMVNAYIGVKLHAYSASTN